MSFEKAFVFIRIICYFCYCYLEAFVHMFRPPSQKSIAGEIVLVTGAGHGIGKHLALELSKFGTTVVVWDLNKESNEKTAEEINKAGGKAFAYVCNVTDSNQIEDVAARVRKDVGEISILVNNAGVLNGRYIMDLDEKDVRRTFEVNILSHFWMVKEFLPDMMKKNHGHILSVVSMAGFSGIPVLADYSSSKAAALNFAEALSLEMAEQGYNGIKVSSLCPMFVDTGMVKKFYCSISPTLTTEEVAEAAVDGLRRNYEVITVPSGMWYSRKFISLLPRKAQNHAHKFGLLKVFPQFNKKDN